MEEWIDGWIDRRVDEWTDGRMDEMERWKGGWMEG